MENKSTELVIMQNGAELASTLTSLVISNQDDASYASEAIVTLKGIKDRWNEYWKGPEDAAKKAREEISQKKKALLDIIDPVIKAVSTRLAAWKQGEMERYRKEKEEAERAEWERRKLMRSEEAPEFEDIAVVLPQEAPSKPVTDGLVMRDHYRFEVVDFEKVPNAYLKVVINEDAVQAEVDAKKDKANIPGIRVWNDPIMARKRR